jgi:microcystin-dependent protein
MLIGDLKMSALTNDHEGWILCDGRSLPVASYPHLYDAIGYNFGGSGSFFNIPNTAGRVLGNVGQAYSGATEWTMGLSAGAEAYFIDISHMPTHNHGGFTGISGAHTHIVPIPNDSGGNSGGQGLDADNGTGTSNISTISNGAHAHTIADQGLGAIHPTLQPTIYIGNTFIYGGRLFRRARDGTIVYFAK